MEYWYFTFGNDSRGYQNKYAKFSGTFGEAREKMFDIHGTQWAFQYSWEEFKDQIDEYNLSELIL